MGASPRGRDMNLLGMDSARNRYCQPDAMMPRIKHIFPTHFFCHRCKVVVPIAYEAAAPR
jgi:hypothetical protein